MIEFLETSRNNHNLACIVDDKAYPYHELYEIILGQVFALKKLGLSEGNKVLVEAEPTVDFICSLFAIWELGAIAIPFYPDSPDDYIAFLVDNGEASFLIESSNSARFNLKVENCHRILFNQIRTLDRSSFTLRNKRPEDSALIIYTSGTTGKPKGVVHTWKSLRNQIQILLNAWEWKSHDKILHVLPLHHVHGLINALLCPLYANATIVFKNFQSIHFFNQIATYNISVFMAVPTIYKKISDAYQLLSPDQKLAARKILQDLRLFVSGSAALSDTIFDFWQNEFQIQILERYGMTEIGMALSNPLHGNRLKGYVGIPLPGVHAILINESEQIIEDDDIPGELYVKSDSSFLTYLGLEEETKKSFWKGWFKTGDIASKQNGYFKIWGRMSSDMIKSAGYKISALEIEEHIKEFDNQIEVAILALPDEILGEKMIAVVEFKNHLKLAEIRSYLEKKLPKYKIPREFYFTDFLPRNPLGKIQKKQIQISSLF